MPPIDLPEPVPGPGEDGSEAPSDPGPIGDPDADTTEPADPSGNQVEPATHKVEPVGDKPSGEPDGKDASREERRPELAQTGASADTVIGFGVAAALVAVGSAGIVLARRGERA